MNIEEIAKSGVIIVPIIIGAIEGIKASFPKDKPLPAHYIPGIAVVLGMAAGAVVNWGDWVSVGLQGLAFGLSAIGLYSGATNTVKK